MIRNHLLRPLTILTCLILSLTACNSDPGSAGEAHFDSQGILTLQAPQGDSLTGPIAFAPKARIIATYGYTYGTNDPLGQHNPYIGIFNAQTGALIRKLPGRHWPVQINSSSTRLLVTESWKKMSVYDLLTGLRLYEVDASYAQFSHDGNWLIVQRNTPQTLVTHGFDVLNGWTGTVHKVIRFTEREMDWHAITPDDEHLMVTENSYATGQTYLLNLETGQRSTKYTRKERVRRFGASQNGATVVGLATAGTDMQHFISSTTGETLSSIAFDHENHVPSVTNDALTFVQAIGSEPEYQLMIRSVHDGSLVQILDTVSSYPLNMQYSADGSRLAVGLHLGAKLYKLR